MSADGSCYRLSGGGNDFLALVEPEDAPSVRRIRAWCTRGLSFGADGLFTLARNEAGVRMRYFNADGAAADLCLNATRCAARLAGHLGWHDGETTITTDAGRFGAVVHGEAVQLERQSPPPTPEELEISVGRGPLKGWFLTVGVPQFVLPWTESLATAPVTELGARIRRHGAFGSAGTNVMFVRFLPPSRCEIRSYERGVEAETLACGTGVVATTVVARANALLELPLTALTGGGFEFQADVDDRSWRLSGDARLLGRIEPSEEAEHLPKPPSWT